MLNEMPGSGRPGLCVQRHRENKPATAFSGDQGHPEQHDYLQTELDC